MSHTGLRRFLYLKTRRILTVHRSTMMESFSRVRKKHSFKKRHQRDRQDNFCTVQLFCSFIYLHFKLIAKMGFACSNRAKRTGEVVRIDQGAIQAELIRSRAQRPFSLPSILRSSNGLFFPCIGSLDSRFPTLHELCICSSGRLLTNKKLNPSSFGATGITFRHCSPARIVVRIYCSERSHVQ